MRTPMLDPSRADSLEGPPVLVVARDDGQGRTTPRHTHARGQWLGTSKGLITVDGDHGRWVVPATYAMWVPPDVPHGMSSHGDFEGWSAYVAPAHGVHFPATPYLCRMSPLWREMVGRLASDTRGPDDPAHRRLALALLDEAREAPHEPLGLPYPGDPRLRRVADAIAGCPQDERRLSEWAIWAHVSTRTLSRRFVTETGFTLTQWRQRARLLRSLELLASGETVQSTALTLGYTSVSAFIARFHGVFGCTPGRYAAGEPIHASLVTPSGMVGTTVDTADQ